MHAWNYGRRAREVSGGLTSQFLPPFGPQPPLLSETEALAALRLGLDGFHAWAVRGWWSLNTPGDNP